MSHSLWTLRPHCSGPVGDCVFFHLLFTIIGGAWRETQRRSHIDFRERTLSARGGARSVRVLRAKPCTRHESPTVASALETLTAQ